MTGAVRGAARAPASSSRGDVQLQSVVEEECTGNGALQCLLDGAHAPTPRDLTEPHPDHFTIAQVGVLWFHVDVARRAGARGAPSRRASTRSTRRYAVLDRAARAGGASSTRPARRRTTRIEHPINLNPGVIAAATGRRRSRPVHAVVPARRCTRGRTRASCSGGSRRRAARAGSPERARCATTGSSARARSRADEPVVQALRRRVRRRARGRRRRCRRRRRRRTRGTSCGAGIPAICFGPRAERIHGIDERVSLRSIAESAQVLALFILDWCGESP